MSIDFEDLELFLAELAAAGAEAPRPEVRERLMATIRADAPVVPAGFAFSFAGERWLGAASGSRASGCACCR